MLIFLNANTEEKNRVVKTTSETKGNVAGLIFSLAQRLQLYSVSEIVSLLKSTSLIGWNICDVKR